MKWFILLFFPFFAMAQPLTWKSIQKIQERHEFYKENEVIKKPAGAWQVLFAVVYPGSNLKPIKDCVIYRVPGQERGILKIRTLPLSKSCEDHMYDKAEKEYGEISSLQFATQEKLILDFIGKDITAHWAIDYPKKPSAPQTHMSSESFKGPGILLLAQEIGDEEEFLKDGSPCHEINDSCEEQKLNICSKCTKGWYEIPNGCSQSPKFCGIQQCGARNQYACRRGMVYQRKQKKYDCSIDSSFAYCNVGLRVYCQGKLAYCH